VINGGNTYGTGVENVLMKHFGDAKMHTPKYRLNDTPTDRETD